MRTPPKSAATFGSVLDIINTGIQQNHTKWCRFDRMQISQFYLHFWLFVGQEEEAGLFVQAEVVEIRRGLDGGVGLARLSVPHLHYLEKTTTSVTNGT